MNPNVSNAFVTATDAAAAEKVICSTPVDQDHFPGTGGFVVIEGHVALTPGTTTTAVVLKCRRGASTSGGQVGSSLTQTLAAANSGVIAFRFIDTAPVAGGQYCVSVTQTGGAGAGTVNDAIVMATAFPQG